MRHIFLLLSVTVVFAALTLWAYAFDKTRLLEQKKNVELQLSVKAQKLEQQYLNNAQSLLRLVNPTDPLLAEIKNQQAGMATETDLQARSHQFDALVAQTRTRLITPPADFPESGMQEWRRIQDLMNGALHRRRILLENLE